MNLLIDIGNSRIKWALQQEQSLLSTDVAVHRDQKELSKLFDRCWLHVELPARIFVSNVAGQPIENLFTEWTKRAWGVVPYFVKDKPKVLSFPSKYRIDSLGIDRWLALLAIHDRYDFPAIIVDCGTAVTADLLSDKGVHLCGVILPGLSVMRESLYQRTNIQPESSTESLQVMARNTEQAIASGTLIAVCGMADRFILEAEQQGHLNPKIILTGGDAQVVAKALGRPVVIEPDLVLMGLMLVASQAQDQSDG